jgi:hypothetical protein
MLDYFAVSKTGAVLRSDNFAECKIVVASRISFSLLMLRTQFYLL